MARLSLPTCLIFNSIDAQWRIETINGATFALASIDPDALPHQKHDDVWKLRAKFFALPETNKALESFLNETGVWSNDGRIVSHKSARHIQEFPFRTVAVTEIWEHRDMLRRALLNKKAFRQGYGKSDFEFQMRFQLTATAVEGVIEAIDTYQALLASVFIDVARGERFKVCARADCGKIFRLETRHRKIFCDQYCGHLVSVRSKREREGKAKRAEARRIRKSLPNWPPGSKN